MKNILITLTMLIMVLLPWTTNAQDIEILNITLNELPTHSGLADNGIFYTASLPTLLVVPSVMDLPTRK